MSSKLSRRGLLKSAALGTGALALGSFSFEAFGTASAPATDPWHGLTIGVATYTTRELSLEDTIKAVQKVGLKHVSVKNVKNHIDISHSPEERRARAKAIRDAGLIIASVGNVSMKNDEADIRRAFEFARDVGAPTMVCAPENGAEPILDKMVKEFNIKLAIHNHGPEDKHFPSPYDVWKAVEKFDKRIGLCIDVGHTARAGVDPAEAIVKCKDRLYDMHLKDISALGNRNTPIECGRGILNLKTILGALVKINYQNMAAFEYEKDGKDPIPGLAECVGYCKGIIAGLR